jgi:hypothetical protein
VLGCCLAQVKCQALLGQVRGWSLVHQVVCLVVCQVLGLPAAAAAAAAVAAAADDAGGVLIGLLLPLAAGGCYQRTGGGRAVGGWQGEGHRALVGLGKRDCVYVWRGQWG